MVAAATALLMHTYTPTSLLLLLLLLCHDSAFHRHLHAIGFSIHVAIRDIARVRVLLSFMLTMQRI